MGRMIALLVGFTIYQLLSHWALQKFPPGHLGTLLAMLPVIALLVWLVFRASSLIQAAGLALAAAVCCALWWFAPANLYWMQHALWYLLCLWGFARTLTPGREAIITEIATAVHGPLPPYMREYTRQVTLAWSVFFAGMVLTSFLLFTFAPLNAWSFFANVLNFPLVLLMFMLEHAYRVRRHPSFPHASLARTITAVARHYAAQAKAAEVK
jgi:uncharacterized membrane protein